MIRVIVLLAVCAVPQLAQQWDKVRGLKAGHELRVEVPGAKHRGALLEVGDDMLRLRSADGGEVSVARGQIERVYVRSKSNRLRNTLIGIGVGVAVGAVVYGTIGVLFRNEGREEPMLLAAPILIGTAAGGLMPTGGMKLVYDSRKEKPRP